MSHTALPPPADMPANPPGRIWAIGVLVLAAAVSMSMNTVHAWEATTLPKPLALMYGIAPVALAAMQSHAVALRALRQEQVGLVRKVLTFGLVAGGLGLSFLGIFDLLRHAVPDPLDFTTIHEAAILFPVTVDLMALAALHELLRLSPSLVSAPQTVVADGPTGGPSKPATEPPEEVDESHDEPPVEDAPSMPTWPNLPALGPLVPLPARATVSNAVNGSAGRPVTVVERVPDEPADIRPKTLRRSTEKERQDARDMYRRSVEYGSPMTQEELGDRFGYSRSWGRDRINEVESGEA